MKFSVSSKVLLTHISAVSKVVVSKSPIAILYNFLFELPGDDTLVVTGSDTENTLVARIPVESVEGTGSFAINVKKLLDLFKEMPDQGVTFEVSDTFEIDIKCLNGSYKFAGYNGVEYPRLEAQEEDAFTMTVPACEIPRGLEKTMFAAGTDAMRPQMMGVLWDIKEDSIVFVSSDTHKLARYINKAVAPGIEGSFILPTKPASVLSGICEKEEGDVFVSFDSKSVLFKTQTYTLSCRFINGKYPNYNAVIPQVNSYVVTVDRNTLLNVVKRVSIFATDGGLMQFSISENKINLKAQDPNLLSNAEEYLTCEYSGEDLTMGFNKDRLIEVLNSINSETLLIKMSGSGRPGLFLPSEQKEDEDWVILIMPMSLGNV